MWRGTAFQCNNAANRISLPHYNFASMNGECNNGEIMAYGVHVANGCYTSHINITMSHDVEGKEVQCALDYGNIHIHTLLVIGNSTITTIGTLCTRELLTLKKVQNGPPVAECSIVYDIASLKNYIQD